MNGKFRAYLMRDGDHKHFADAHIEAPNREQATSAAIEWASRELATGVTAPTSLFMEIGDKTWLVERWSDV